MGKRQEKIDAMPKSEKCTWHDYGYTTRNERESGTEICHFGAKTLGDFDKFSKPINPQECEDCPNYRSQYLEFPQTITDIEVKTPDYWGCTIEPVRIRLCEDKKTYFGIYLGQFPRYITARVNDKQEMEIGTCGNPCIFVPEKKRVYFGDESWWQRIEPGEEISDITDETIQGQWYMKLLHEFQKQEEMEEAIERDYYAGFRQQENSNEPKDEIKEEK